MKKFLAFSGLLSSMSVSIGSMFKMMHWPGANVLMFGGLAVFCLLFAPLWLYQRFKHHPQETADRNRWTAGLIAGMIFASGGIFELMHWQGAGVMLMSGGFIFTFAFLPMMFARMYGDKQFG